jgi:hypothetical protein
VHLFPAVPLECSTYAGAIAVEQVSPAGVAHLRHELSRPDDISEEQRALFTLRQDSIDKHLCPAAHGLERQRDNDAGDPLHKVRAPTRHGLEQELKKRRDSDEGDCQHGRDTCIHYGAINNEIDFKQPVAQNGHTKCYCQRTYANSRQEGTGSPVVEHHIGYAH